MKLKKVILAMLIALNTSVFAESAHEKICDGENCDSSYIPLACPLIQPIMIASCVCVTSPCPCEFKY